MTVDHPIPANEPEAFVRPSVLRGARRLCIDGSIILAVLTCFELVLQATSPRYRNHLFDASFTGGHPTAINADGFRGSLVPRQKPSGELRLLFLGDSCTFGSGVPFEATFPHRLESRVRERTGRKVAAINAGIEGASLRELSFAYSTQWNAFTPDVVVLAVTGNFVSQSWIERDEPAAMPHRPPPPAEDAGWSTRRVKTEANRLVKRLCFPSFFTINAERGLYRLGVLDHTIDPKAPYGTLLAHGWKQVGVDPSLPDRAWAKFEEDLAELGRAISASGARLIVTTLPARFTLSDNSIDNEKRIPKSRLTIDPPARTADICRRIGIEYVESAGALRAARAATPGSAATHPLYIQADYSHLDEDGHDAVASALAEALTAGSTHPAGTSSGR